MGHFRTHAPQQTAPHSTPVAAAEQLAPDMEVPFGDWTTH